MGFQRYIASVQGYRAMEENCIVLGKTRIGLGSYQFPWPYVIVHYDKDIPAIMFTEGNKGNGFKVNKNGRTWYLAAASFTKRGLIPLGMYERTDDKAEIFKLIGLPTHPNTPHPKGAI